MGKLQYHRTYGIFGKCCQQIKKATETPKVTESNKKKESPKAPVVSSETPKSGDNTNVIVLGFITIISAIIMLLSKFFANKSKRY